MIFEKVPSYLWIDSPEAYARSILILVILLVTSQKVIWPVGGQIFTKTIWCFRWNVLYLTITKEFEEKCDGMSFRWICTPPYHHCRIFDNLSLENAQQQWTALMKWPQVWWGGPSKIWSILASGTNTRWVDHSILFLALPCFLIDTIPVFWAYFIPVDLALPKLQVISHMDYGKERKRIINIVLINQKPIHK